MLTKFTYRLELPLLTLGLIKVKQVIDRRFWYKALNLKRLLKPFLTDPLVICTQIHFPIPRKSLITFPTTLKNIKRIVHTT